MVQKHYVFSVRLHFRKSAGTFPSISLQVQQPIQINGLLCLHKCKQQKTRVNLGLNSCH